MHAMACTHTRIIQFVAQSSHISQKTKKGPHLGGKVTQKSISLETACSHLVLHSPYQWGHAAANPNTTFGGRCQLYPMCIVLRVQCVGISIYPESRVRVLLSKTIRGNDRVTKRNRWPPTRDRNGPSSFSLPSPPPTSIVKSSRQQFILSTSS